MKEHYVIMRIKVMAEDSDDAVEKAEQLLPKSVELIDIDVEDEEV
jgi:hypothetical protein